MSRVRLNDLQLILLSHAGARDSRSVMPPPATADSVRIDKEVRSLLKRGLLVEDNVSAPAERWRSDGDQHFAVRISDAGLAAIGLGPSDDQGTVDDACGAPEAAPPVPTSTAARGPSKISAVIALLERDEGATLDDLIAATGWLPHTTRAALTGLRRKGHALGKTRRDGVTFYRIPEPA